MKQRKKNPEMSRKSDIRIFLKDHVKTQNRLKTQWSFIIFKVFHPFL